MNVKTRIRALSVLMALLLVSVMMVPVVSADEQISFNTGTKEILVQQLDKQVTAYNLAVKEQNLEKIRKSIDEIDTIVNRLSENGHIVDFSMTSQITKSPENQNIPTSISFTVRGKTKSDMNNERSFTANEKQLQVYNQLDIENISTGEFLEKVFPEALIGMPESTKKYLYQTSFSDSLNENNDSAGDHGLEEKSAMLVPPPIVVHPESYLSQRLFSMTVDFSSDSRVWLPNPFYAIPYMSVVSELRKDNGICYALDYKDGYNVYYMKAGFAYTVLSSGNYKTKGGHIAEVGPLYIPPAQTYFTETNWIYIS